MSNQIPLTVQVGNLPDAPSGETRQQYAEAVASRLLVTISSDNATFVIGGSQPTSDVGPWFREGVDGTGNTTYFLYVWSADQATYVPLALEQEQLRYWVGGSAPDQLVYDVWFETNTDGRLLSVRTFDSNTNVWENVYYTRGEVDGFFAGESAGKKQIEWDNVLNKPSGSTNPRASDLPGNDLVARFDYEIVYHTGVTRQVLWRPDIALWVTLDGGVNDTKEVLGNTVGTQGDFNNGVFNTVLGRNPGWDVDLDSQGKVVVGANPGVLWSPSAVTTIEAGSLFGASEHALTIDETPRDATVLRLGTATKGFRGSSIAAQYDVTGLMVADVLETVASKTIQSATTADAHTNIQPSIARWRLKKVF